MPSPIPVRSSDIGLSDYDKSDCTSADLNNYNMTPPPSPQRHVTFSRYFKIENEEHNNISHHNPANNSHGIVSESAYQIEPSSECVLDAVDISIVHGNTLLNIVFMKLPLQLLKNYPLRITPIMIMHREISL